jgi:small GTP-binding protein
MLGDSSVGKTSIVIQFYKGEFEPHSEATVGASYVTKTMQTQNGELTLHIWDTAGQERFKSVIPMYMRGCSAVILVCAVDLPDSLLALDNWLTIIQETVASQALIYVCLNKIDLEPTFEPAMAEKWATDHDFKFFQTSAKERGTVVPVFQEVAEAIAVGGRVQPGPGVMPPIEAPQDGKKCC